MGFQVNVTYPCAYALGYWNELDLAIIEKNNEDTYTGCWPYNWPALGSFAEASQTTYN